MPDAWYEIIKKRHESNNNQTGSQLSALDAELCGLDYTPWSLIDPEFCCVSAQEVYSDVKCWVELWELGV